MVSETQVIMATEQHTEEKKSKLSVLIPRRAVAGARRLRRGENRSDVEYRAVLDAVHRPSR